MKIGRQFQSMFAAWQRAARTHDSDGQALAVLGDAAYTRQFKMPKWNGTASPGTRDGSSPCRSGRNP